jgi:hypothetical protein
MTPQYLIELADLADPDELWHLGWEAQRDTGVALRRAAAHQQRLQEALAERESLLLTPLSTCGVASAVVPTPKKHAKLRRTDGL